MSLIISHFFFVTCFLTKRSAQPVPGLGLFSTEVLGGANIIPASALADVKRSICEYTAFCPLRL